MRSTHEELIAMLGSFGSVNALTIRDGAVHVEVTRIVANNFLFINTSTSFFLFCVSLLF